MELVNPLSDVIALPDNILDNSLVVTLPDASVVTIFVLRILLPIPSNLTSPVVCNCAVGVEVPIPMFPPDTPKYELASSIAKKVEILFL